MDSKNNYIENCRIRVFDKGNRSYLMGIAILWIVLLHLYCWFQGKLPWWIYFFSDGQTGVDIFLFLSAYGLEASYRKNGWSIFYKKRMYIHINACKSNCAVINKSRKMFAKMITMNKQEKR